MPDGGVCTTAEVLAPGLRRVDARSVEGLGGAVLGFRALRVGITVLNSDVATPCMSSPVARTAV